VQGVSTTRPAMRSRAALTSSSRTIGERGEERSVNVAGTCAT
jgi:hypothetical protein